MGWIQTCALPSCAQIGDMPPRRSGHTLCISSDASVAYMFGGCDQRRPPRPNNELYKPDSSDPPGFPDRQSVGSGKRLELGARRLLKNKQSTHVPPLAPVSPPRMAGDALPSLFHQGRRRERRGRNFGTSSWRCCPSPLCSQIVHALI